MNLKLLRQSPPNLSNFFYFKLITLKLRQFFEFFTRFRRLIIFFFLKGQIWIRSLFRECEGIAVNTHTPTVTRSRQIHQKKKETSVCWSALLEHQVIDTGWLALDLLMETSHTPGRSQVRATVTWLTLEALVGALSFGASRRCAFLRFVFCFFFRLKCKRWRSSSALMTNLRVWRWIPFGRMSLLHPTILKTQFSLNKKKHYSIK